MYPRSLLIAVGLLLIVVMLTLSPPSGAPYWLEISIAPGESLVEVGTKLESVGAIRSRNIFVAYMVFFGVDDDVKSGTYYFREPLGLASLARRITSASFGAIPVRLVVPEGLSVREMAPLVHDIFPHISNEDFIASANMYEGRLFPDTYFFGHNATVKEIVQEMIHIFEEKVTNIDGWSSMPIEDRDRAVILASIIEEEARELKDKVLVSGVLKNRLSINMPLQVDVTFRYINGKTTQDLTLDDLAVDSPYNTYKYIGLPPTPISNPGLDSLTAAVHPAETDFWYFLADSKGVVHYSKTYGEHLYKKSIYIK